MFAKFVTATLLLFSFFFFFFLNKFFSSAEMTMRFNQGMYAKMRAKKNEPLSSLKKTTTCIMEKGVFVTPPTSVIEPLRIASPATLVEEIKPLRKKQCMDDKGKDKADFRLSSVFDDAGLALARAQEAFTTEELRVFYGMPSNEVVGCHIHKLVQVVYLCNFTLFFFFFLHRPECWIFFLGSGGEPSHYLGVPYSQSEGCIGGI